MIIACLVCVVLAVTLLVPPPAARTLKRLNGQPELVAVGRTRAARIVWLVVAGMGVMAAAAIGGAPGGAVACATALALATTGWLLVRHRSGRAAQRARAAVARACGSMAAQVHVGRVATEALFVAAADHAVLGLASRTLAIGGDPVATLRAQARTPGHSGLDELARAWQLAADTGAPMAGVLDQVAESLRADLAVQRTLSAELAGPRATGKVMAVLPLCGVGMGYLLGGDPLSFMLAGPLGWGCLVGGVGLACIGVLWIDRLARVAEQG